MQPNPTYVSRPAYANAYHPKSYDPSAPYRAMMMPPPPANLTLPPANPYSSNPRLAQEEPYITYDPKTGTLARIPQYYYPLHDGTDYHNARAFRETNPNIQPLQAHPPYPNEYDPYASNELYPYDTPYLVPVATTVPQASVDPYALDRSRSDVIAAHKKDADLSRLEVYHFTPKHDPMSTGVNGVPPVIQYHVYPPVPASQTASVSSPSQQQPYLTSQYHQNETKARSSQTEEPTTRNRGVSPMHLPDTSPVYDDDGFPHINQKEVHTDRYNITTGRVNRRVYDKPHVSTALPDCRCLDCQKERSKVLNYYPD